MTIDWFTVIAQAVNFLVLLWLMKRFLYKPVLHAIDQREKGIAEELSKAETQKGEAQKQKEEYDQKKEDLNRQSAVFLKKAQEDGQAERQRLLEEARDAAEVLSTKRHEALVMEEKSLRNEVNQRIQKEALAIARKVLKDLAGASLEEQMVGVFTQCLGNLDDMEIKTLTTALKTQPGKITLRTAFDISRELQITIEDSIQKIVQRKPEVNFEAVPELISGIELSVNGQKMSWSVADYLSSLSEGFEDLLKVKVR
ncbi:MAG: F0F1 ATP synthase subunit B [Spirochaetaceae bacterium]|nr:F0F1 ATP synthase subunit B [Spirochaetaceae bacterium]